MSEQTEFSETQLQFIGAMDIGVETDELYVYKCVEKSTGKIVPIICLFAGELDKMIPIGVLFSENKDVENYEYPKSDKSVDDYTYKGIPLTKLI